MLAFKCDICGKLFEEDIDKINHVEFSYIRSSDRTMINPEGKFPDYDICPFCRDTIKQTIDDLKNSDH